MDIIRQTVPNRADDNAVEDAMKAVHFVQTSLQSRYAGVAVGSFHDTRPCVRACVCVCVCERERERERERACRLSSSM